MAWEIVHETAAGRSEVARVHSGPGRLDCQGASIRIGSLSQAEVNAATRFQLIRTRLGDKSRARSNISGKEATCLESVPVLNPVPYLLECVIQFRLVDCPQSQIVDYIT